MSQVLIFFRHLAIFSLLAVAQGCILDSGSIIASLSDCQDNDGDGYGLNCDAGLDCNDNDADANELITAYLDADGDSVGQSVPTQVCSLDDPANGGLSFVSEGGDCNDSDPDSFELVELYGDNDGDGFYSPISQPTCVGVTIPTGFQNAPPAEEEADCNDSSADININSDEIPGDFIDQDCDGEDGLPSNSDGKFVAKTGNDSNAGTIQNPYLTIGHAVTQVAEGKIIFVAQGTYTEAIVPANNVFGAYSNNFKSQDVDDHATVISGPTDSTPVIDTAFESEISIAGVTVTLVDGQGGNVYIETNGDLKLNYVTIAGVDHTDGSTVYGIYHDSDDYNLAVQNSTIEDLASTSGHIYGIYTDCDDCGTSVASSTIDIAGSGSNNTYGIYHESNRTLSVVNSTVDAGDGNYVAGIETYGPSNIVGSTVRTGTASNDSVGIYAESNGFGAFTKGSNLQEAIAMPAEEPEKVKISILGSSISAGAADQASGIELQHVDAIIRGSSISTGPSYDNQSQGIAVVSSNLMLDKTSINPGVGSAGGIGLLLAGSTANVLNSKINGANLESTNGLSAGIASLFSILNIDNTEAKGGHSEGTYGGYSNDYAIGYGMYGFNHKVTAKNSTFIGQQGALYDSSPMQLGIGVGDMAIASEPFSYAFEYGYGYGENVYQNNNITGGFNDYFNAGMFRFTTVPGSTGFNVSIADNTIEGFRVPESVKEEDVNVFPYFAFGLALIDQIDDGDTYGAALNGISVINNTIGAGVHPYGGGAFYQSIGVQNQSNAYYINNDIDGGNGYMSTGVETKNGRFIGNRIFGGLTDEMAYGVQSDGCAEASPGGEPGPVFVNNFISGGKVEAEIDPEFGYGFEDADLIGFAKIDGISGASGPQDKGNHTQNGAIMIGPSQNCETYLVNNTISGGLHQGVPYELGTVGVFYRGGYSDYNVDFWVVNNILHGGSVAFDAETSFFDDSWDSGTYSTIAMLHNLFYEPENSYLLASDGGYGGGIIIDAESINGCGFEGCWDAYGNIAGNPGIDFSGIDFHADGGAGVNAGINPLTVFPGLPFSEFGFDIDGNLRNLDSVDMGADEQ